MKHMIDKYFKQKLDTPQQPPENAWDHIQNHLPKEKRKKIVPFWMRLSGIAAVLFLTMGIGYWLGTENNSALETPGYVISPGNNNSENSSQIDSNSKNEIDPESEIPNYLSAGQNNLITQGRSETFSKRNSENEIYSYSNYSKSDHSQFTNYNDQFNKNTQHSHEVNVLNFENLSNGNSWNNLNLNPTISLNLPEFGDAQLNNKNETLLAVNKKTDQEKDKKKKKHVDFDRFHISAFASPLAFNTFVGNSMLADEMSEYRTDNNVTLAYGVKAAYSLTPKLKVRTGVSVVGLEQITHDIPLAVDISGRTDLSLVDKVNNINYLGDIRIDNHSMATSLAEVEMTSRTGYGDMQQQTSYIEIPLEAELSLFQTNSIGISATGGGSTWVLSKNKIYVHTDDYTQELGEANNLNNVTFSANAGLKFDMNLTEDVKLNVEPNFRYLFNPVSNIEKYNPYTIGVNAGISISLK